MPHDRFYLNSQFQKEAEVELSGEEAHHLQVMRKREGEIIELVNGQNQLARAKILSFGKKQIALQVLGITHKEPSKNKIILCQALCRPNRLDTIVEKGTELGMDELWLFPGQLSEKKELTPNQLERLHTITIAAMKQCGRLDLPKIIVKEPLLKWQKLPENMIFYFGDTDEKAPWIQNCVKKATQCVVMIGPEAGFSDAETEFLRNAGAQGVRLHSNILRTETAAIAALVLVSVSF